jgi:hypothetical protein
MKNRNVARLIIAALLLLGVALLTIPLYILASYFYSNNVPGAPASTKNPPIYPGAEDVRSREERQFPGTRIQIVTFQTSDEPDTVITFYKDALAKDGWTVGPASQPVEYYDYDTNGGWKERPATQSRQSYHYVHVGGGGMDSDPEFTLSVETNVVSSSQTNVELVLNSYPSR